MDHPRVGYFLEIQEFLLPWLRLVTTTLPLALELRTLPTLRPVFAQRMVSFLLRLRAPATSTKLVMHPLDFSTPARYHHPLRLRSWIEVLGPANCSDSR